MANKGIGGGVEKGKSATSCVGRNLVAMRGHVEGETVSIGAVLGSVNGKSEACGEVCENTRRCVPQSQRFCVEGSSNAEKIVHNVEFYGAIAGFAITHVCHVLFTLRVVEVCYVEI